MIIGLEWLGSDDWLSRWLFERALAITYLVAFATVLGQFRPLLGEDGLLPVPRYLAGTTLRQAPSLFRIHYSDRLLTAVGWIGVAVAALLLVGLPQRAPLGVSLLAWLVLWFFYLSVVNVGQRFYGFGWETLLLETGFIALFLGNDRTQPPVAVLWLLRWLLFRVELGAGLIKIRGDRCWRDLTCLAYHHETQPMPNPLSRWFHLLPAWAHRVEVAANHFTQLVVPWFLFAPEPFGTIAAMIILVTQCWLMLSGNFSWLNFITIALALAAIDGSVLARVLPIDQPVDLAGAPLWHNVLVGAVTVLVVVLSWWPVKNMASKGQAMNASFTRLHFVNTYGAFGSITRVRQEILVEGTADPKPEPGSEWREYEFKAKPGNVDRRPRQFAPYHLRLDWMMWFAALSPGSARGWFDPFVTKLLQDDEATVKLLAHNPFPENPPRFIRATLYRYRFTTRAERRDTGAIWNRELIGEFRPPMSLDDG